VETQVNQEKLVRLADKSISGPCTSRKTSFEHYNYTELLGFNSLNGSFCHCRKYA